MARILVIDDDEMVRATMRTLIEGAGHEVVLAEDGGRGLEEFERRGADLVVTDIVMPEMEGIETIRTFRARYPSVPIIAISGRVFQSPAVFSTDYLHAAAILGATETLRKPFTRSELLDAINTCLGQA